MFTSRSFDKKFGRATFEGGRGYTPLWPWRLCFLLILGLIIALLLTIAVFLLGNLWKVAEVRVEGEVHYEEEELIDALGIEAGDSMTSFDRKLLEARMREDYPLVRRLKIRRKLSGEVTVRIEEEQELYYTRFHDNYYLISADDLLVLGVSSFGLEYKEYGAVYLGLPEEARVRVGETLSYAFVPYEPVSAPEEIATFEVSTEEAEKEYAYVMKFARAIEASAFAERLTGMETSDRYDIYLVIDAKIKIRFGTMTDLDRKISQALSILSLQGEIQGPALIDVSNLEKSTFRENPDIKLPDWAQE